jgi:3-(3-hydroxy-phenyl)propionate hydroxylase
MRGKRACAQGGRPGERASGRLAQICHRNRRLHREPEAAEDFERALLPRAAAFGCLAVIRPERVVLHDGSAQDADRLVRETLTLLRADVRLTDFQTRSRGSSHA